MEGDFRVGDWLVRPDVNQLEREGKEQSIEPKVMDVLVYLLNHPGEVLSKERLIQAVWPDTFVTDDALKYAIVTLRKVLGDNVRDPRFIRTIPKRGYQLIADVRFPEEAAAKPDRYRIERKLGEGGMGEVWLALDKELNRRVALKFLRPEQETDEIGHRRLRREARAAAALDHPYICKVYDTGTLEGRSFIAMEYLEGEKLSDRLRRRPLRLARALCTAQEIAEGLEEAHRHGIVHRDIKPSNVILTEQGHIKITDFGIAKRFRKQEGENGGWTLTEAPPESPGTPDYMSPEQIRGDPVDQRSDLFQFGMVLYEMLTRVHPFRKAKQAETTATILQAEPAPLNRYIDEVPDLLEHIVRKLLAKDPNERYQSVHEIRTDLVRLVQPKLEGTRGERKRERRSWAVALILGVVLIAAGGSLYWFNFLTPNEPTFPPMEVVPFTSFEGGETEPAFSPDGQQIAFAWKRKGQDNFDIYVKMIGVEVEPRRLTTHPMDDASPVWSPDGTRIAFFRFHSDDVEILEVPSPGGAEQTIVGRLNAWPLGWSWSLDWSPDSRFLAFADRSSPGEPSRITLLEIESGEKQFLTTPPPKRYESYPVFSPDGRQLAFARGGFITQDIYIVSVSGGEPRRITHDPSWFYGLAWTPDSENLVASIGVSGDVTARLWRISLTDGQAELLLPGQSAFRPSVAPQGGRLAFHTYLPDEDIWRLGLPSSLEKGVGSASKIIASTRPDSDPQYSPDGKHIAFGSQRSGYNELWLSQSDGSNPVKLTSIGAAGAGGPGSPRWAPDGLEIAFDGIMEGNYDIYVMSVEDRRYRRLTQDVSADVRPSWSGDGDWIYFGSDRSGTWQIWKIPSAGGAAVQVTRQGGFEAFESSDGAALYYTKGYFDDPGIWRVPVAGGPEIKVCERGLQQAWAVGKRGVYYIDPAAPLTPKLEFYDFATTEIRRIAVLPEGAGPHGFSVSPDDLWILFNVGASVSDIMLVENFR